MHRHIQFDPELIKKYDVVGPRYTSYPTALQFVEAFDTRHYAAAVGQLGAKLRAPLSLYMHVPFCDTVCYYCACNKIVTKNRKHAEAYLGQLIKEMSLHRRLLGDNHEVVQLHFGGGTPTYFTDDQFDVIFEALHRNFNLAAGNERDFSIEIDPRTVDAARIHHLSRCGLNRVSLGIQDFDPNVQKAVNRLQNELETAAVIDAARAVGFRSVSVDLIYGLPLQSPDSFRNTLYRVLDLDPDRLSIYSYAHLPQRFKTQRQIASDDVPTAETKLVLLQTAIGILDEAGYEYIGMDHFAKPNDSLVIAQQNGTLHRNFQGYSTHGQCDLIGLGVSAISSVNGVYCQNAKDLPTYTQALNEHSLPIEKGVVLSDDDVIVRDAIRTLMCYFRLDVKAFEMRHGIDFKSYFKDQWERLAEFTGEQLVELELDTIRVTDKGRFLIRNICMVFDRYLPPQVALGSTPKRGFSRAI